MVNKYFQGKVEGYTGCINDVDKELEEFCITQINKFNELIDNFEIANSLQEIWNLIARTNKYIDETSPWILAKNDETEKLKSCIYH